jgi:protein-S-isoprenylcysteine O-methyltransferase Ste14
MGDSSIKELLNRLRVRAGLIAATAVILLARPTWISIIAGVSVSLLGLFFRAWASGHLRKEKELTISGPYGYSRNPLYLGNFTLGVGVAAGSRSWWVLGIVLGYFALFYPLIIRRERDRMRQLFPEQYENYRKRVPSFFPSLRKRTLPSQVKFNWSLYKQNKEYRALTGTIAFWLILAAKILVLNR